MAEPRQESRNVASSGAVESDSQGLSSGNSLLDAGGNIPNPPRPSTSSKARKRTKTGCLSKIAEETARGSSANPVQHVGSGASNVERSGRRATTASSPSETARATSLESSSKIHSAPIVRPVPRAMAEAST